MSENELKENMEKTSPKKNSQTIKKINNNFLSLNPRLPFERHPSVKHLQNEESEPKISNEIITYKDEGEFEEEINQEKISIKINKASSKSANLESLEANNDIEDEAIKNMPDSSKCNIKLQVILTKEKLFNSDETYYTPNPFQKESQLENGNEDKNKVIKNSANKLGLDNINKIKFDFNDGLTGINHEEINQEITEAIQSGENSDLIYERLKQHGLMKK